MEKVFIVTSGEYSSYEVNAAFSSEELAQKFIDTFSSNGYSRMEILEVKLNPFEKHLKQGRRPFFLRIDREGNTSDIEIRDDAYGFEAKTEKDSDPFFDIYGRLVLFLFADDENHAIKIANEKRIQILASNSWPSK